MTTTTTIETLAIDAIKPYWRNPREITDEAVEKTAESIQKFGYQQPIIVDKKHVIIAGHTRYAALRKLGWTEVAVVVSSLPAKKANEYRIIDNKTSEYAGWDEDLLAQELREFSTETLSLYFPEVDLSAEFDNLESITDEDVEAAIEDVSSDLGRPEPVVGVKFMCPSCLSEIEIPGEQVLALAEAYKARNAEAAAG